MSSNNEAFWIYPLNLYPLVRPCGGSYMVGIGAVGFALGGYDWLYDIYGYLYNI